MQGSCFGFCAFTPIKSAEGPIYCLIISHTSRVRGQIPGSLSSPHSGPGSLDTTHYLPHSQGRRFNKRLSVQVKDAKTNSPSVPLPSPETWHWTHCQRHCWDQRPGTHLTDKSYCQGQRPSARLVVRPLPGPDTRPTAPQTPPPITL